MKILSDLDAYPRCLTSFLSNTSQKSYPLFFSCFPTDKDAFLHTREGGSDVRVMSVKLPSVIQDQESVSLSSVEGDTDSSANDVF